MVVKTRLSTACPNHEEHLENVARRCRVKKSIEKAQQEEAWKELLKIMANNRGKVPYGKVDRLDKNYNSNGFKAVTRQNLYYWLSKRKDSKGIDNSRLTGRTISTSTETQGAISDVTEEPICNDNDTRTSSSTNSNEDVWNAGGRKKGTTKKSISKKQAQRWLGEEMCHFLPKENRWGKKAGLANVPNGTLKKIVNEKEEKQAYLLIWFH